MSIRILILALTMQASAFAKTTNADIVKASPFSEEKFTFQSFSEEDAAVKMKLSESKRKPAEASMVDESMMSKKLKEIQSRLFALKTSEEVEVFLNDLDKNYDSYPADAKFYVAQVMPVKAFRGSFYRLRSLFKGKSNYIHSQVLTTAKSLAARVNAYFPDQKSKAVYQYISAPYFTANNTIVKGFGEEADVQLWAANDLLPLLITSVERLEKLSLVEPIVWDQRMLFGADTFSDGIRRFKLVGECEKNIAISTGYASIVSIAAMRAYGVENSIKLSKEIGSLYGLDGFGVFKAVDGVSAEKVSKVLGKSEFSSFGMLMPDGKDWMKYAYEANKKSLKRLSMAWDLSAEARKNENLYMFNTNFLAANREELEENLNILKRVVMSSGVEALRSGVTGEVVDINYSKFFLNPPSDLKQFRPISFVKDGESSRVVTLSNGKKETLKYVNYLEGSANGWNLSKFSAYFPSVKTNDDVYRTVRVLSHIQGNWLAVR